MNRKTLALLIAFAVVLAVVSVSIEAQRGGGRIGSIDGGRGGGGMQPVPGTNISYNGNYDGDYPSSTQGPS